MTNNAIVPQNDSNRQPTIFQALESIKHVDEDQNEHWSGRELMPVLEYSKWQNFVQVIDKARIACDNAGNDSTRHFTDASKMVDLGSGIEREVEDFKLSRFACYLIAQNGDSRKETIALAQTYFAMQARRQEVANKPQSELQILQQMMVVFGEQQRQIADLYEGQGQLALTVENVVDRLDDAGFLTILQFCQRQRINVTSSVRSMWGKQAGELSRAEDIEIKSAIEGMHSVGRYHISILLRVCRPKLKTNPKQPPLL